ncbi:NAD(P)H-binding protein [Plantactinospora mayteni]|uniref:Nucleotide-diphosphate-sugar epimerase n=1 Tax=Plantactinospora mayteni TaxID=566021 RepID=A0ABQ4F1J7_9ACTN|nr:NAD(P)H-binding protein [Plantactinospora mayteni]GIH00780.1 nucleotide-diphosphate-sugar epimerase [Plantactinospora mayteni]
MTNPILVTGGTGRLGRALVPRLLSAGHAVRLLSRQPPPDDRTWRGDLLTGDGLAQAVTGVGVIIHCATGNGRGDTEATRNLIQAAVRAGRPHLIYVSIVGVDRVALSYYRAKLACERLLEASGLPWTIQRTTQFHDLIVWMCDIQRWLPAIVMPAGVSFQPIDTGEVAARLADLASAAPVGRAPDMGGPEVRAAADLARAYARARSSHRPVLAVPLPGSAIRGYRQGGHLAPDHTVGRITFDQFLAA